MSTFIFHWCCSVDKINPRSHARYVVLEMSMYSCLVCIGHLIGVHYWLYSTLIIIYGMWFGMIRTCYPDKCLSRTSVMTACLIHYVLYANNKVCEGPLGIRITPWQLTKLSSWILNTSQHYNDIIHCSNVKIRWDQWLSRTFTDSYRLDEINKFHS